MDRSVRRRTSSPSTAHVDDRAVSSPLDQAVDQRDLSVMDMVKDAVAHDQAVLAFQPIARAENPDTVAFYEGLMRIPDATGRIIPAAQFMPSVENTGLGRTIDAIALDLGCRALNSVPGLRLSVNMSARSIGFPQWRDTLTRWMAIDSSIGARLILEITESSAMIVPELVVDFMDEMQMHGICFALDDFGAGHTVLRYFKDFFFDILKIDGQFIKGIAEDPDLRVLAQAMASIGHHFDMLCIAEKVENAADAEIAKSIGVDCLQGYHFGAPKLRPDWLTDAQTQPRRA